VSSFTHYTREVYNAKDEDVEEDTHSGRITPVSRGPIHEGHQSRVNDDLNAWGSGIQSDLLQLVESSRSHQEFDELLITYYVPMETWYMRTIIDKVFVFAHIGTLN
jgi:hypothetical protein